MNAFFNNLTMLMGGTEAAKGGEGDSGSMITTIITFALVFVVFYFLIIRPQNKKQKDAKKMMSSLKKGDKIQTIGGLRGTVFLVSEKDDVVIIKTDDDVKLEFVRSAIATIIDQQKPAAEEPAQVEKTEEEKK